MMRLVALSLTAVLTACGTPTDEPPTTPGPTPTPTVPPKPEVEIPDGDPPAELVVTDLREGRGRAARTGDLVIVHYVGVSWTTRDEFDNSYDRGKPLPVLLRQGQVIQGWEEGLVGVAPGGRRRLVIPPALAYGSSGQGPIPPDDTLVFVVDVMEVRELE